MAELLEPTGVLICLEFPRYKDLQSEGPPWGLRGVYWNLLAEGGDGILQESEADDHTGSTEDPKGIFQRIAYEKPSRSYAIGKGTDMLSVWALKS